MLLMSVSLIIPVFNGARLLDDTVKTARAYLEHLGEEFELIVVNDGSTDDSPAIVEKLARECRAVRLIDNHPNRGKGNAVRAGMLQSRGSRAVFIDADLAYPISEVGKILAALDSGADVAIANRVDANSTYRMSPAFFGYLYTRHLLSRAFNLTVRGVTRVGAKDCQAGLKGFRRAAIELIFPLQTVEGFTFDVELLYLAKHFKLVVREVPVEFHYFSEPSTIDFMRDGFCALRDLVRIRRNAANRRYG